MTTRWGISSRVLRNATRYQIPDRVVRLNQRGSLSSPFYTKRSSADFFIQTYPAVEPESLPAIRNPRDEISMRTSLLSLNLVP